MGSDRARKTFDEGRKYRRVVAQQGRVVVDADLNESQEILTEEIRKESFDVVGNAGTPNNGYQVILPTPATSKSVSAASSSTNQFTVTSHGLTQSQPVFFQVGGGGVLPSGISANTPYYVIYVDVNHFSVATLSGSTTPVALVTNGTLPFNVLPAPLSYDIQIGTATSTTPGIMYVDGMRVTLESPVYYSCQSEWLLASDPVTLQPAPAIPSAPTLELVYLWLREHDVSATEDAPLRDVALGGPDTAQRTRLTQRIGRFSVTNPGAQNPLCSVMAQLITSLGTNGQNYDTTHLRVTSQTTLLASFASSGGASVCNPTTQTGYLGAENDFLRIQVSQLSTSLPGPTSTANVSAPVLVWAHDNASALYPIVSATFSTGGATTTFTLGAAPVDVNHYPTTSQYAEILFPTTQLDSHGNLVAAMTGFLLPIATAYNPTNMTVVVTGIPSGATGGTIAMTAFMRIWDGMTGAITSGALVTIGTSGLQVTLTKPGGVPFVIGDYWTLALRPSAPTQVFPQRYLDSPQPPEGPRQWMVPLGVVSWVAGPPAVGTLAADCRQYFSSLVTLKQGWLDIIVNPADVDGGADLQSIIDRYALNNPNPVRIGLMPGTYTITQPLMIGPYHGPLTIQAKDGATIQAQLPATNMPGTVTTQAAVTIPATSFLHGLIIADNVNSLTLDGLTLNMVSMSFASYSGTFYGLYAAPIAGSYNYFLSNFSSSNLSGYQYLHTQIGLRILGGLNPNVAGNVAWSQRVTVTNCTFQYASVSGVSSTNTVFAAGILAEGSICALQVNNSNFEAPTSIAPSANTWTFGILHTPAMQVTALPANPTGSATPWTFTGQGVYPSLTWAVINNNYFSGLSAATLLYTLPGYSVFGQPSLPEIVAPGLTFHQNSVVGCYSGLWAISSGDTSLWYSSAPFYINGTMPLTNSVAASTSALGSTLVGNGANGPQGLLADQVVVIGTAIARAFPLWRTISGNSNAISTPGFWQTGLSVLGDIAYWLDVYWLGGNASAATIEVSENRFINGTSFSGAWTGPGNGMQLLLWDYYSTSSGVTAVIRCNQLTSYASAAVAATIYLVQTTLTGNTVSNSNTYSGSTPVYSMVSVPNYTSVGNDLVPFVATGNVFSGPSVLPVRPANMVPARSWVYFNEEQAPLGVPSIIDPGNLSSGSFALYSCTLTVNYTGTATFPVTMIALNTNGFRTTHSGSPYVINALSTYWLLTWGFASTVGASYLNSATSAFLTFNVGTLQNFPAAGNPVYTGFTGTSASIPTPHTMPNAHANVNWVNTGTSGPAVTGASASGVYWNGTNLAIDFGNWTATYNSGAVIVSGFINWWYLGASPPTSSLISTVLASNPQLTYYSTSGGTHPTAASGGQYWWLAQVPVTQITLP